MNAFAIAERAWLTPPAAARLFSQLEAMQRDSLIEDLKCELCEWGHCV